MAEMDNYSSYSYHWGWTGIRNLNQVWSYFRVDDPIIVQSIEVFWGGYDRSTSGRHFISRWNPGDGFNLDGLIVASGTINVPQGRAWRTANIRDTFLEPGAYAVGIWGDYYDRRTFGLWNGDGGGATYVDTQKSLNGSAIGKAWDDRGAGNVIPCRFNYEPAGRMHVNIGGSHRAGQAWINTGGSFRKGRGAWVNSNGVWRRGQ